MTIEEQEESIKSLITSIFKSYVLHTSIVKPGDLHIVQTYDVFHKFICHLLPLPDDSSFYFNMAGSLRFTAAKTSVINKRSGSSALNPLKKLLPSQAKYQQNNNKRLQKKNAYSLSNPPPLKPGNGKGSGDENPLQVLDYNVQLDYQLSKKENILVAIDTIVSNQWSESSTLQSRYHSIEVKKSSTAEELVFLLSGLSMQTKAEIIKYRTDQLPKGLVTVNQLYSIYEKLGHTFVDRSLELKIREGKLKKFVITNASPVILRSPQKFQSGKVTYGFENVDLVVEMDNYLNHLQAAKDVQTDQENVKTLEKFTEFVKNNPTELFVSAGLKGNMDTDLNAGDLSKLVNFGYVTLTSNHLNEIESHQYAISYPNCGSYLKLVNAGRSWLVKLLSKAKFKEILEDRLWDKWEGNSNSNNNSFNNSNNNSFNGKSNLKMSNFRKPYYGFELNWILADALGAGVVEVFSTPVGRGWRLTGKI